MGFAAKNQPSSPAMMFCMARIPWPSAGREGFTRIAGARRCPAPAGLAEVTLDAPCPYAGEPAQCRSWLARAITVLVLPRRDGSPAASRMLCLRPSPPASDFGAGDTWACGAGGRAQMATGDSVLTLVRRSAAYPLEI